MSKPKQKEAVPAEKQPAPATSTKEVAEPAKPSTATKIGDILFVIVMFLFAIKTAYGIRLYAIQKFGRVIHEFDPWFNMRTTQYLADHGAEKFFTWFDHESWYPLGRPVGTTIYPGMQFVSVWIWKALSWPFWKQILGYSIRMSLNDVCVFVPAWFGASASVFTGLLTREVSGSWRSAGIASIVMAVIPAHTMRSVGGGFDNESVAMTAMVLTFYLWCRSLRTPNSWPIAIPTAFAYFFMVASWGGYVFVCNMIGLHAGVLVLLGYFSQSLHRAYSLWYVIGTFLAMQVPVVNWTPLTSLEQIGPLAVFLGLQVLALCDEYSRRKNVTWQNDPREWIRIRVKGFGIAAAIGVVVLMFLVPTGYFGPLSARVRSLFIKHTKTGNPLVDSVAEHQPASADSYYFHLHDTVYLLLPGFFMMLFKGAGEKERKTYGVQVTKWFIIAYELAAYYFCNKMVRLLILMGPVASVLAGVVVVQTLEWCFEQFRMMLPDPNAAAAAATETEDAAGKKGKEKTKAKKGKVAKEHVLELYGLDAMVPAWEEAARMYNLPAARIARAVAAVFLLVFFSQSSAGFWAHSDNFSHQISQPSIIFEARLHDGTVAMINDYQESYWWLRDNTPQDARVLSWWDYGYQIAGIGNRTTLADGNTWNLEHIALVGRILTSPEKRAHQLARHVADYVLIWAGTGRDDLAKSPHIARIANSVFHDICPNDPLCNHFGFYARDKPTPSMANSILYKMHSANLQPGVSVDPNLFREVYRSKYGLVRIYEVVNISKKSKAWCADPANRLCDRPGSWYCPGQYPPGLMKRIGKMPTTHRHLDYEGGSH
eukprot:Colp12_sorted_trinity150504_noHs@32866